MALCTSDDEVRRYTASLTGGWVSVAGGATDPLTGISPFSDAQAASSAASDADHPAEHQEPPAVEASGGRAGLRAS